MFVYVCVCVCVFRFVCVSSGMRTSMSRSRGACAQAHQDWHALVRKRHGSIVRLRSKFVVGLGCLEMYLCVRFVCEHRHGRKHVKA